MQLLKLWTKILIFDVIVSLQIQKKNALIQLFGTERLESKVFIVKALIKV